MANVVSKFGATLYGFAELDMIHDSTQGLNDNGGNAILPKGGTYAADHGRMTFGIRNSRLGVKLKGPESEHVKSSGVFEVDFYGAQAAPNTVGSPATNGSEQAFFTSAMIRSRHYYLKFQTPVIDILAGQTWHPFGWQGLAHPNTVQVQGIPGELFNRTPQLRLSHAFKSEDVDVEIMAAAVRPPQRNAEVPEAAGGIKASFNKWKGIRTAGAAGTSLDAAQIGVSGVYRRFRVAEYSTQPKETVGINGWGVAVDALLPVIPATSDRGGNALTLNGEYVYGQAINDLYSGFNGGVGAPANPTTPTLATGATSPWVWDVDNGAVTYSTDGTLHAVRWQTILAGAQYYLPMPEGTLTRLWVSANYARINSSDIDKVKTATNTGNLLHKEDWVDGNLFVDLNPAVRFGAEYAYTKQTFLDDSTRTNHRIQVSSFFIF